MSALVAGLLAGVAYIGCYFSVRGIVHCKNYRKAQRQHSDVFNISGNVQGQPPGPNSEQVPPYDAYVTIEHIYTTNQMNKPAYEEPPSYEEAIRLAESSKTARSNMPTTHISKPTED